MNKEEFINELKKININISNEQLKQLEEYYQLLISENKKYNLTAITEKNMVYLKHFFDSITISKVVSLNEQSLCDIGTGAGFPGLILKIMFPNLKLTLVDSAKKKCQFLQLVANNLKIKDISIINERAEIYSRNNREQFDIVTSRAVAPLKHLLEYSIPLVKVNGLYIAMKSDISKEIENIEKYEKLLNIKKIDEQKFFLPNENSLRTLIVYKKIKQTNIKYPRNYKDIKKRDLD